MISSKKITLISITLLCVCLAGIVLFMAFPPDNSSNHKQRHIEYSDIHAVTYTSDDYYTDYSENGISKINLMGNTAKSESKNVATDNGTITINGGGTYVVSGTLNDGCIIIDSGDSSPVRLVLNNADITSSEGAAIYVKQAEKTVISLPENTKNSVTDSKKYNAQMMADGASASICSEDDLVINGKGTLIVNGNFEDGIKADDTLKITQGKICISAVDEGINVNDYIATDGAIIETVSGGDGVKCDNTDRDKGFIASENTNFDIVSSGDGISASSAIYMTDSSGNIESGGGSDTVELKNANDFGVKNNNNKEPDSTSGKSLKAGINIIINGGTISLNSADDAIHSDNNLTLENCVLSVQSGDDAVHAENTAVLNHKKLKIEKCLEGVEAGFIHIKNGETNITASDDGINALGNSSEDLSGPMHHRGGKENISSEDIYLTIDGGNINIMCAGDGLDSNGAGIINGGNITVYGPENRGNASLDFEYGLIINGGTIVAAGSSAMAGQPHSSSKQVSLSFYLNQNFDAGSTVCVTDKDGNEVINTICQKKFDWVCVSSDKLKVDSTYTLYVNGEKVNSLTVTGNVTSNQLSGRGGF